jgi:hypothetical protein
MRHCVLRAVAAERQPTLWCGEFALAPRTLPGGIVDAAGVVLLTAWVREQNDRTLEELGALYHARRHVTLSRSALSRRLIRLGLGRIKSR